MQIHPFSNLFIPQIMSWIMFQHIFYCGAEVSHLDFLSFNYMDSCARMFPEAQWSSLLIVSLHLWPNRAIRAGEFLI